MWRMRHLSQLRSAHVAQSLQVLSPWSDNWLWYVEHTHTHIYIYIHTHKYTRITISYFKGICMSHHVILISTNFIRLLGSTSSKFQEVRQWFAIWRISQGSGNILVSTSQWLVSAVKIITKCLDLVSIMLVFIKKQQLVCHFIWYPIFQRHFLCSNSSRTYYINISPHGFPSMPLSTWWFQVSTNWRKYFGWPRARWTIITFKAPPRHRFPWKCGNEYAPTSSWFIISAIKTAINWW